MSPVQFKSTDLDHQKVSVSRSVVFMYVYDKLLFPGQPGANGFRGEAGAPGLKGTERPHPQNIYKPSNQSACLDGLTPQGDWFIIGNAGSR